MSETSIAEKGRAEYRQLVEAGESWALKAAGRIKTLVGHRQSDLERLARHEQKSKAVEISLRAEVQASLDDYDAATHEAEEWGNKYVSIEAREAASQKHARELDTVVPGAGGQGSLLIGGTRGGHAIKRPGPGRSPFEELMFRQTLDDMLPIERQRAEKHSAAPLFRA